MDQERTRFLNVILSLSKDRQIKKLRYQPELFNLIVDYEP